MLLGPNLVPLERRAQHVLSIALRFPACVCSAQRASVRTNFRVHALIVSQVSLASVASAIRVRMARSRQRAEYRANSVVQVGQVLVVHAHTRASLVSRQTAMLRTAARADQDCTAPPG